MASRYTHELLQLAAQPAAAERVLRLITSPRSSPGELAQVVETDPALSALVMRLANSPYYGASRRVGSTRHAIVLLGFDTVRGVAAGAACRLLDGCVEVGPDWHWRHAVHAAATCAAVADKIGVPTAEAFSVGLLHDIGAVLLHHRDAVAFDDAARAETNSQIAAREIAAFGMTHAHVGADALDAWGFPRPFVEAVALHQHGVEPGTHILARVLKVAEAITAGDDLVPAHTAPEGLDRLLGSLRLRASDLDAIARDVGRQIERVADVLGVGP